MKQQIKNLNQLSRAYEAICMIFLVIVVNRCVTLWADGLKSEIPQTLGFAFFSCLPIMLAVAIAGLLRPLAVKICPGYKSCYDKSADPFGERLTLILSAIAMAYIVFYQQNAAQFEIACGVMVLVEIGYIIYAFVTITSDLFITAWVAIRKYAGQIEAEELAEISATETATTEALSEAKCLDRD